MKDAAFWLLARNTALRKLYYAYFAAPSQPDFYKAKPESAVIAEECRKDWLDRIKKELESIRSGR